MIRRGKPRDEDALGAHEALGLEEVDRCVNYRKSIAPAADAEDDVRRR